MIFRLMSFLALHELQNWCFPMSMPNYQVYWLVFPNFSSYLPSLQTSNSQLLSRTTFNSYILLQAQLPVNTTILQQIIQIKLARMLQPPRQSSFHQIDIEPSQSTDKKLMNRVKKSNIRSLLPPIQMPTSKRSVCQTQGPKKPAKKKTFQMSEGQSMLKPLEGLFHSVEQKQAKTQKKIKFDIFKILENERDLPSGRIKRYIGIAKILSYLYNQSEKNQKIQVKDINLPKYKVYSEWELHQIQQNYKDTNLGDFIIKMVNPDFLPEDYKQKKDISDDKNQASYQIDMFEALEKYDQLFNTEEIVDKNLEDSQKQAFQLAFFLLEIEKIKMVKNFKSTLDRVSAEFMRTFDYFVKIEPLNYVQYVDLKKDTVFKEMQHTLQPKVTLLRQTLEREYRSAKFQKAEIENQFNKYKIKIYEHMRMRLLRLDGFGKKKKEISLKDYETLFEEDYNRFLFCLLKTIKSISQLLKLFPQFTQVLMVEISEEVKKMSQGKQKRLSRQLFGGGYLSRVSHQGQLKWILGQQRPRDVLTLVRKFMIYRLNCRGGLFIRSFLSKQQTHIFLVIKASERHLQKMAQQSNFNMEIELGSVDIFSFEPVDRYGRPLRCNNYIRDPSFIKKYNLAENKQDKDQDLGQKSVQSQGLNIYKKALKMNQQQLRAKIILDQEQCDKCYSWLSNKINTRFVQPDQILNNELNQDQIQDDIWPVYYVYNKLITEYLKRLKLLLDMQKHNKKKDSALYKNIGLILRLMFLKALNVCNDLYFDHRDAAFRTVRNVFTRKHPLQTIWNLMGEDIPRGYFPYSFSKRLDQIWRKYQINQQKDRSKFSPAARLIMTNKIIREYLNISKSLMQDLIIDFYPIHDPYVLKHIKLRPYINVLSSLIDQENTVKVQENQSKSKIADSFVQYECQYTQEDFTKDSMENKLGFRCRNMTEFSVNSVAFYCGEKLAFFFEFRRWLTERAWPLSLICFIIQILFWVENTQLQQTGVSTLTSANNVLMIILVIINTFWTELAVASWTNHEKILARTFGTNDMNQKGQSEKRVLFEGQMKRNLQTNQINHQHQVKLIATVKQIISLLINLIFVILMAATILIIFTLKGQMYQLGYPQSSITLVPSILISLSTQVYNFAYSKIIGVLVEFQNKKTVHQYENSLITKSFIVTFVVTYFCLFIYAFFEQYFEGDTVCAIKVANGSQIVNCYYYLSSQLVTSVIIEFIVTIVMAFKPLGMFFFTRYQTEHQQKQNITFNLNYFQSIDTFYEEQDKMQTYMYTDEIDKTWLGYTAVVISFTTLALFAPIVPFLYFMMFLSGVVTLNAKKYEIIYFSKRTLPIKTKSIGSWLTVIKIISVIAVFVNVGLILFVREAITQDRGIIYFACVFVILGFKYVMSFADKDQDLVGKRCRVKTQQIVAEKAYMNYHVKNDLINTDIENLFYDERRLKRKLPALREANVRYK